MRLAVLDTNILVSALHNPQGPPGQVLAAVKAGLLQPVFCQAILDEYEQVLTRPRLRLDKAAVRVALEAMSHVGHVLEGALPPPPPGLPDPSDWPFMACTLVASCPVISGNARHFPAALGVGVISARAWVERFTQP